MKNAPVARLCTPSYWSWDEDVAMLRRLAYLNTVEAAMKTATMEDADSAALIWEKFRTDHDLPFECLLACVLRTGEIMGIRKERSRRKKA